MLSADEKRVAVRYMEAYAAMLAHCDDQIGRVVEELRRSGQLDNTLVIYIQGDNGSSPEGGAIGSFDYASRAAHDPVFRDFREHRAVPARLAGCGAGVADWANGQDRTRPAGALGALRP
jgi:arylsulfatase A-like enzyme